MLLRVYQSAPKPRIIVAFLFVAFINCVTSRSIATDNFTVDESEVPARYVFEIDEVPGESSEIDKNTYKPREYSNSSLMFNMPIAVAIFAAVMFLICCFCCLRCTISYDGIKRNGFYGGWDKRSKMNEIVQKLQLQSESMVKN